MPKLMKIVQEQLIKGALVGLAGGIIAVVLAMVLGAIPVDPIVGIVVNIVLLVALIVLGAKAKLTNVDIFDYVVLLTSIAIAGSILNLIVPNISAFILTSEFTISGILMSFIYIGLAVVALRQIGVIKKI